MPEQRNGCATHESQEFNANNLLSKIFNSTVLCPQFSPFPMCIFSIPISPKCISLTIFHNHTLMFILCFIYDNPPPHQHPNGSAILLLKSLPWIWFAYHLSQYCTHDFLVLCILGLTASLYVSKPSTDHQTSSSHYVSHFYFSLFTLLTFSFLTHCCFSHTNLL